jgi:hypothetical protein
VPLRRLTIRLVDLELDDAFGKVGAFGLGVLEAIAARTDAAVRPEIELVRTRELATLASALEQPAHVIHLVAHLDASAELIGFYRDDERTAFTVEELIRWFGAQGRRIRSAGFFADAGKAGSRRFVRAVRECSAGPVAFIGAAGDVTWSVSTAFAAPFYAALLDTGRRERDQPAAVLRAAERAAAAYRGATGRASAFRPELLTPPKPQPKPQPKPPPFAS